MEKKIAKPRLNRRRFEAVTRLLKTLVADKNAKIDLRFRAAERLLDLYAKLEDKEARAEERAERSLEREHTIRILTLKHALPAPVGTASPEITESPEDRARRFLMEVAQ